MRILYLGDIYGTDVLDVLEENLPKIKKENNINLVFANAENVTDGKGLAKKDYKRLMTMGISALSMGNHTFSKSEIFSYMDDANIVIPSNYNIKNGKKVLYVKYNQYNIAIINMLGRIYSSTPLDDPFKVTDEILKDVKADYIIIDFHGDATSEKKAFFYKFASRVSAIIDRKSVV